MPREQGGERVLLDEWQVELYVPADLSDANAFRLRDEVETELRRWAAAQTGDAAEYHLVVDR